MLIEMTLKDFIEEVASQSPAPGGGSISAMTGTMSAALVLMVCNLTLRDNKYVKYHDDIKLIRDEVNNHLKKLIEIRLILRHKVPKIQRELKIRRPLCSQD